MYFWAPRAEASEQILFYGVVEEGSIKRLKWREHDSTYVKTVIYTPRGIFTSISMQKDNIHTLWTIKHLCESKEDALKVLSIPHSP